MADINIELIYIDEQHQILQHYYPYSKNCTIENFLNNNQIYQHFPVLVGLDFAVFGKIVTADYILQPHDRIEFLRQLQQDPKARRKAKAKI
jgi:putative ubiquitin-RnfH superfamily antitoxin RatB of RatAB toxin-antitoxin module